MKKIPFSKLMTWIFINGIILLIFMTLMRWVFYSRFSGFDTSETMTSGPFFLGLRYDLRIVCGSVVFLFLLGSIRLKKSASGRFTAGSIVQIALSVLLLATLIFFMFKGHASIYTLAIFAIIFLSVLFWIIKTKNGNPFESKTARIFFKTWLTLVIIILVLSYAFDFEHYDYLQQRLSASIINFAGDAKISLNMILETYPVFTLLLFVAASCFILIWLMHFTFKRIAAANESGNSSFRFISGLLFTLLMGLAIFGRFNQYPLRWSDAFAFKNDFKANLALNPVQSFLSTLRFRNSGYDLEKVKKYYPLMSRFLHVDQPDADGLNYIRKYTPAPGTPKRNVVIVIAESFSMYKSSMSGNAMNTTPFFSSLCESGIFFEQCYTPAHGTARGVWATITGIPDVEYPNTSSRNPEYVDQHSIINDYDGYKKYYFIGGSLSWANIRGLLINNISGLHIMEEDNFNAKKEDVWGISDKQLFLAANDTLSNLDSPFIAVIQTADNHRPYTIPAEDRDEFDLLSFPEDTLYKYGFTSNEELNAFRYSDFAFQKFIEAAKKEAYFDNTIFVFVGDHGVKGDMSSVYPQSWTDAGLSLHHVPLLFYAPSFLEPVKETRACSQSDILASVSALAGVDYANTTLGINLFDSTFHNPAAFIYDPTVRRIGVVSDGFVYNYNLLSNREDTYSLSGKGKLSEEKKEELRMLTDAWYETSKYLLRNNQKNKAARNQ